MSRKMASGSAPAESSRSARPLYKSGSGKSKGFLVIRDPQKHARRWFELYSAGRLEEAAAQLAEESRQSKLATDAAIDARLLEIAQSRRG